MPNPINVIASAVVKLVSIPFMLTGVGFGLVKETFNEVRQALTGGDPHDAQRATEDQAGYPRGDGGGGGGGDA
jgi:hypothetical protein